MRRPIVTARLRRLRAHLPSTLDPLADGARDLVHDVRGLAALSRWVSSVHEGPLPRGGPEVRVQYLGRAMLESDALLAFRQHAVSGAWRRDVGGSGGLLELARARRDPRALLAPDVDVLLVDPLFAWAGDLEGALRYPVFLRGALALAPSLAEQIERVRSKPYRRVLKRAARHAPAWRVSRSEGDLREFYDAMYEPLARERFGRAASVSPYARLQATLADRGELLLVERDGVPVIGALLYRSPRAPGTLFNWKYGVRDPAALDAPSLRELTASLEVALVQHTLSRGDARVDFGLTHAIANDGVFLHKRRLGCDFTPLPRGPELLLRFAPGVEPIVLERAPLFVRHERGLRCLAGYTGARHPNGEPLTTGVLREHSFDGCADVTLYAVAALDAAELTADLARPVDVVRCTRVARTPSAPATAADSPGPGAVEETSAARAHDAPREAPAGATDV